MKKFWFLLLLVVGMTARAQTQSTISGDWRAVTVVPDGTPDAVVREFFMELKADGASVTGTATGIPIAIRQGRIEGNAVTLNGVNTDNNNQPFSMAGNLVDDEIVFNVVGLAPRPLHIVARRITKVEIGGSISDAAQMDSDAT